MPSRLRLARSVAAAMLVGLVAAACVPPPPPAPPEPPPSTQPATGVPPAGSPDPATFHCPLTGSTYSASYGPRAGGFHYGIDMFAPTGTAEHAVGPGRVTFQVEDAGGNAAYLFADDGNVYYYAHLQAFVGAGNRRVAKGEAIGLLGATGNATAPHLHFEIRVGGATGTRIDPYPTLVAAGC